MNKFNIITLCGSAKFKDEFFTIQQKLTLEGNIVFLPVFFDNNYIEKCITSEKLLMLKEMHKNKIDLSNEIYVINKNGYIGNSTKLEIEYAIKKGKKVNYLEQL